MQRIQVVAMFSVLGVMGLARAASPQAGLIERLPDGDVLLYFAQPLDRRQPVFVQRVDDGGRLQCCDRLEARKATPEPNPPTEVTGRDDQPVLAYRLRNPLAGRGTGQEWRPYVGVALSAGALTPAFARSTGFRPAPLRSAGQAGRGISAYLCWGTEGVNLMSRSAQGWSWLYFGLNYDVLASPACDALDIKRMRQAGG